MLTALLGSAIPNPPPNVDQSLDEQKAALARSLGRPPTDEEARQLHTTNPGCASCHGLIDPLGKPLVAFDSNGLFRPAAPDTKAPFDTSATVAGTPDLDGRVADWRSLARKLAASRTVAQSFARLGYEYALGRAVVPQDECHVAEVGAKLVASGGDVKQLFVDILGSDAFRTRAPFAK